MRKIEANIRKLKFKDVKIALREAGYPTFTYWAVRSVSENSTLEKFEDKEDAVASERVALNIAVRDDKVEEIIDIMVSSGQTHEVDDALIYVYEVKAAYKIRGEEGGDRKILRI